MGYRNIPPGRFHPSWFPPTQTGFVKYVVDANLFPLESSILTRAKRATNRNNAATNRKNIRLFRGGIYPGGTFRGGVYLEPDELVWFYMAFKQ